MKLSLKKLFTTEQHKDILFRNRTNSAAAAAYTELCGKPVSRQLCAYWRTIYSADKPNAVVRQLRNALDLVKPDPTDDLGNTQVPDMSRRIMVIGDMHVPYHHQDALEFLKKVRDEYKPDTVVQIGDLLDQHSLSFHDSNPDLSSAGDELTKSQEFVPQLAKLFPNLLKCHSNHGSLIYRRAFANGIPVQYIKKYRDIIDPVSGVPGWSWAYSWDLNTPMGRVRFQHQVSGDLLLNAAHEGASMVIGHFHGKYDIRYAANSHNLYFGAHCGCLIDSDSMAFAYGRLTRNKPIMGVMTITDGCPALVPMLVNSDNRWVDRKRKKS